MRNLCKILLVSAVIAAGALAALPAGAVHGQGSGDGAAFLRRETRRDSTLIGDRVAYGVLLRDIKEGSSVILPDFSKGFRDSVEVLSSWRADTLRTVRDKATGVKSYDIEYSVPLTSFDEGEYWLPDIVVSLLGPDGQADTLAYRLPEAFPVKTIPVDTATFSPHDIRRQAVYPVTFSETLPYIGGALALCAAVLLIVWLVRRRKRDEARYHEPAHITALRKLDKYRGSRFWVPERQKEFYSGVTDALREYMAARYGFGAMEMTTAEILDNLKDTDVSEELRSSIETMFGTSDFVKFAKMTVPDDENAAVLPAAVRFVTETYQKEIETASGEETK